MDKNIKLIRLIEMLREIDLEKNNTNEIREVLDYIADALEEYID